MISYKAHKFKELVGEFPAQITGVSVEENQWGDPTRDNYTEQLLAIDFAIFDADATINHTQRFITPLVDDGGYGLFSQLLDVLGIPADVEGGEFDEQKFVGLKVTVVMGNNAKGYRTVQKVLKNANGAPEAPTPDAEEDSDLDEIFSKK